MDELRRAGWWTALENFQSYDNRAAASTVAPSPLVTVIELWSYESRRACSLREAVTQAGLR